MGRTYKQSDASGFNSTKILNSDDQEVGSIDGDGNLTVEGFNDDGDNAIVIDARKNLTQKIYNADNLLIGFADSLGNQTNWEYNVDGQKIKETDHRQPLVDLRRRHRPLPAFEHPAADPAAAANREQRRGNCSLQAQAPVQSPERLKGCHLWSLARTSRFSNSG